MTVGDLLKRVTSRELSEWMAYETLEPFGPRRADHRAGVIASLIYNSNRGKGAKPLGADDFFPETFEPPQEEPE